ncbi:MAG: twin-arginine translocation signal domain-containing protein, partial [Halieaceae bacterium]|nr:twin-arginine translocation signal domain-containing protein [Halieaceae bacterium]
MLVKHDENEDRPVTCKTDKQLGMHRSITRRDFVQGSSLAVLGAVTSGA